ncbi:hypothetical protein L7F22_008810, partial [Adiantum nelumboides]|nr:hypothetical protein [Adiantum nelumboides]
SILVVGNMKAGFVQVCWFYLFGGVCSDAGWCGDRLSGREMDPVAHWSVLL